ncbi:MAG: nucleoside triphosphate pyrophosphohydrolase [Terriglobia bacterium]
MTQTKFEEFVQIMARLRGEGGCPWDREQTYETLKNFLIEETYEAVEAIENKDFEGLCEELGDVLLEVVFLAQIAREEHRFTIDDVIDAIGTKMVRRHPHVFGDKQVADSREVLKNWEEMKKAERAEKRSGEPGAAEHPSILDGVTRRIPAVLEASQLSQRAARVGFDWSRAEEILEKLHEEMEELQEAMRIGPHPESEVLEEHDKRANIEDEIGDIIFVAVNLARHFKIDPESALKKTNQKFRNRFRYIECMLARSNKSFEQTNLQEMERYWQEAKRGEPGTK